MDTAGSATAFHQYFKQRVNDVQDQIDSLSRPELPAENRRGVTENILANLTKLSAALADTSSTLASYDQRSYNQTIKTLQDQLLVSQATTAPKTKFSFKSKKPTAAFNPAPFTILGQQSHLFTTISAPASDVDSATTSRSATPSHLQDPEDRHAQTRRPIPPTAPPPNNLSMTERNQKLVGISTAESKVYANTNEQELRVALSSKDKSYVSLEQLRPQTTHGDIDDNKVPNVEHLAPQACVLSQVSHSVVNLAPRSASNVDQLSSLTLTALDSTILLAPAVTGPVHITNVRNSTLVLSCRQFRMHDSYDVDIYLHCTSRPIIENCKGIRFAGMPTQFLHDDSSQVNNMYDQVDDFKWLRAESSPNWRVLPEDEQIGQNVWTAILQDIEKLDSNSNSESPEAVSIVASVLDALGVNSSK